MDRDRNIDRRQGQPVEPGEARAHGQDPDAVRVEREGGRGAGGGNIRETEVRQPAPRRQSSRARSVSAERHEDGGEASGASLARRDSTRWGPVWAGLVTALTTFLLLQLLAIGIGLVGIGPQEGGAGGIVPAIIGLIAFFVGGAVAGMTSAVRGAMPGLINGFLVWALGVVAILLLSALGLGQIFGALGNVVGQVGILQNIQQGGVNAPNVDPSQITSAVRTGALGAFFGLLLSAVAAAIGGLIGGGPKEPIGYMARDRNS